MKGGIGQLMKQAQEMQANMKKAQEEMASLTVTGESGAGVVRITMTCQHQVQSLEIDDALIGDDKEMLEDLVVAARASLREEGRPDPFGGDPEGFRAWVTGRIERAHVLEDEGRVVFVAYADVQRAEGWLLQGVYTWPDRRRRGFARAAVAALGHRAAAAGAAHLQLAVVEDNLPALGLYAGLGFHAFLDLRTILFH